VNFNRAWRTAQAFAETEYFRRARANLKDDHYHYARARVISHLANRGY